jgi:UDP-N-acetylmuramate: L-alanyl-gamma-D-glutamyl-meso-diaminopimelate ligase
VIEGDEYDSAFFDKTAKFLKYLPDVAVVNNVEFDHADIYADLDAVLLAFRRLVNLVHATDCCCSVPIVLTPKDSKHTR